MASYSSLGELHQNREPNFLGSSQEHMPNFHIIKTPILISFDPKSFPKLFLFVNIHQKSILNTYKHEFTTTFHHKFNIKLFFFFLPKTHIFTISPKLLIQHLQFKPQQHINLYNHLSSEFRHV